MPRLRERYSLARFQQRFATEEACLDHLEQVRWPYGPVCPRCGVIGESSRLTTRPRVRQCAACHKQFSVTAHTPLHKTHLPLSVWFTALYLLTQAAPIDPRFANPYFLGNPSFREWAATGRFCDSNDGPASPALEGSSQNGVTVQPADVTL